MTFANATIELARIVGEPEAATLDAPITGELDTPYFYKGMLERNLLRAGQSLLRTLPEASVTRLLGPVLPSFESAGTAQTYWKEAVVEGDIIRVVNVLVDDKPAVESSVAGFFQRIGSTRTNTYAWQNGTTPGATTKIMFLGSKIYVLYIRALALSDWQAWEVLPDEFVDEWLFRAYERLMCSQKLPAHRN